MAEDIQRRARLIPVRIDPNLLGFIVAIDHAAECAVVFNDGKGFLGDDAAVSRVLSWFSARKMITGA